MRDEVVALWLTSSGFGIATELPRVARFHISWLRAYIDWQRTPKANWTTAITLAGLNPPLPNARFSAIACKVVEPNNTYVISLILLARAREISSQKLLPYHMHDSFPKPQVNLHFLAQNIDDGKKRPAETDLNGALTDLQPVRSQITRALVARAMSFADAPLRSDHVELARQCVLDWVGVALSGSQDPLVGLLIDQAIEDGGQHVATLVGRGKRVSVRQAALINGAIGHAIDYDDVNVAAQVHVTAAVLPATLAVAEARGLSGDAVLRAFVAGYEMVGMVGQYLGRDHYERGFHGTATVGSFGAACAAACLMQLNASTTSIALGIAGTQAGGVKAQFGTMCKPLHAGKAAENGVTGAQLAARGFTGRADLLEATQGFADATSQLPAIDAASAIPQQDSYLNHNLFKYHAACYGTHASIEAIRELCRQHRLAADDIDRIELDVESGAQNMCDIREPRTGLEAKFSLRLNAALAVTGADTSSPAVYSDAMVQRADLVALRDRVRVQFMPGEWPRMLVQVRIHTYDGRQFTGHHDSGLPESDLARQRHRLGSKFFALAVPVVGADRATSIFRAIAELEQLPDIGVLMSMLR